MTRTTLTALIALLVVAPAAQAKTKPHLYGTTAKANQLAAHEIYQTYFDLDPQLLTPGEAKPTFRAGCRRLTARTFRCDWAGENPDYYSAAGVVRVAFHPYGADAVLSPGARCTPEGAVYDETGVSECP